MDTTGATAISTASVTNGTPVPIALDPSAFGAPSGTDLGSKSTTAATVNDRTLSEVDRSSLSVFLSLFRAARAEVASEDKAIAKKAAWQVAILICYLAGFFDSRGMLDEFKSADAGFEALIGKSVKPDIKQMLDEIEHGLAQAIVAADTRSGMSSALHGAAEYCHELGTGLIIEATVLAIAGLVA